MSGVALGNLQKSVYWRKVFSSEVAILFEGILSRECDLNSRQSFSRQLFLLKNLYSVFDMGLPFNFLGVCKIVFALKRSRTE